MLKRLIATLSLLLVAACTSPGPGGEQAQVVDRAATAVERVKSDPNFQPRFRNALANARAVLVIPDLVRGGFLIGGEYGSGVLLVNDGGQWSYPAFFRVAGGSAGLQFGLEGSEVVFIIRTQNALDAVLSNKFKFGAQMGVSVATVGAGMGASTTGNLGADILAFSRGAGIYGGGAVEGAAITPRPNWDALYYGGTPSTADILFNRAVTNAQAERLRAALVP